MRWVIVAAAVAVTGCATTPAKLATKEVKASFESAKSARDFAYCVAENLSDASGVQGEGDHYWVLIQGSFGNYFARWDFTSTKGGSKAEVRATGMATRGDGTVEDCA